MRSFSPACRRSRPSTACPEASQTPAISPRRPERKRCCERLLGELARQEADDLVGVAKAGVAVLLEKLVEQRLVAFQAIGKRRRLGIEVVQRDFDRGGGL